MSTKLAFVVEMLLSNIDSFVFRRGVELLWKDFFRN